MSKFDRLKINRYLRELDFLKSDFEYKSTVVDEMDSAFLNSVNEFLNNHPELKSVFDKTIDDRYKKAMSDYEDKVASSNMKDLVKSESKNSIDEESNNEEDNDDYSGRSFYEDEDLDISEKSESEIKSNKKIKKLYRDIVKLTHPDVVKNKKLNDLYVQATILYESNDISGLYLICNELGIEYDIDVDEIGLIDTNIKIFKSKIDLIESSFTYVWYNSNNETEKNNIIVSFIHKQVSRK